MYQGSRHSHKTSWVSFYHCLFDLNKKVVLKHWLREFQYDSCVSFCEQNLSINTSNSSASVTVCVRLLSINTALSDIARYFPRWLTLLKNNKSLGQCLWSFKVHQVYCIQFTISKICKFL